MQFEHDKQRKRFIVRTSAGSADLTYEVPRPGVIELQHTFVPRDSRGEGIAEGLAQHAFDYARKHDLRVVPTCSFVRNWLESNPDQADIVEQ